MANFFKKNFPILRAVFGNWLFGALAILLRAFLSSSLLVKSTSTSHLGKMNQIIVQNFMAAKLIAKMVYSIGPWVSTAHRDVTPSASSRMWTVWPDWAIYCTFGNFSKPIAINCPHFWSFLGKCVKMFIFCWEIIFGQLLYTFGDFLLVTLNVNVEKKEIFENLLRLDLFLDPAIVGSKWLCLNFRTSSIFT